MKQIVYYGIGLVIAKLVAIFMLPIMTGILSPAEYGTLEILQTFINILLTIFCLGQGDAIFRFGGMASTKQAMDSICLNAGFLVFSSNLFLCIPMILFASQISSMLPGNTNSWQIVYLALLMIPSNILVVQLDWLRLQENALAFVWTNVIRTFIQAGLVLIVLYAGYGVTGIMFVSVISNVLIFLYFLPTQLKGLSQVDLNIQKRLFLYGIPLIFAGLGDFVIMSLDIWWLGYAIGAAEMAKFALAMKFAMVTLFLIQPFTMWWYPKRFKYINHRDYCAKTTELGVILGMICAFSVTLGGSLFVHLFISKNYQDAILYLPLCAFIFPLKIAGDIMSMGLFLEKTKKIMWINNMVAVLTMIGFYFSIPLWHVWGALYILCSVLCLRWLIFFYYSQKELYLPYRYLRLGLFIVVYAVCQSSIWLMGTVTAYVIYGGGLWLFLIAIAYYLKFIPPLTVLLKS
ncbi:oligosaccharide flippase family protein [Fluoribacter gormanii]|uniref:Membrane protein involved in the export of O-antigen and teichoic acid n=1 Tax=Fluoribacter gormanii TaxID=464 RepID=A0A377GPK4_9GAMM|nr:oligosaccharide flippase family protein [Fluoribacter gormanii]KTD04748.1 Polysaccharide biosynthesis protein [Fluoribacter gormanii]MCW8470589.1 oligosaccharide flippase family protein [Fluoribacter gormanii]SIR15326.1 Membrane protein involved in the export of O-antigen and teichoic acid [Fluoribacter gormanii]STO26252.1 Polysaccharide biosynthesis protein [Fluoribacter gormanii]